MPRTCSICHHSKRPEIDTALLNGEPYRGIAKRFDAPEQSVYRHKREHLPQALTQAHDVHVVAQADDLLGQVRELRSKSLSLLTQAEQAGDIRTALQGVREARACVELLLEVEGELDRRSVTNITISPEWIEIRAVVISALGSHPEAVVAVSTALQRIEGQPT